MDNNGRNFNKDKKRSLIISISNYQGDLPILKLCQNDGMKIKEILIRQKYEVRELSDTPNTFVEYEDIKTEIYNFFTNPKINNDDILLFYYSGHAILEASSNKCFLSSSKIDPLNPFMAGFSFDDLKHLITQSLSNKIVIILDCCFSGIFGIASEENMAKNANTAIETILEPSKKEYLVLASSLPYQESSTGNAEGLANSLFTHFIIEGLEAKDKNFVNSEGSLTFTLLRSYVNNKMNEYFQKKQKPLQRPVVKKSKELDNIILAEFLEIKRERASAQKWNSKGHDFLKLDIPHKAIACYDQALSIDPNSIDALVNKGIALSNKNNFKEGLKCYNRSLEILPNDPSLWDGKGQIYDNWAIFLRKDLNPLKIFFKSHQDLCDKISKLELQAIKCFDIALKLSSISADSLENKGIVLSRIGKYSEALECYDQALKITPDSKEIKGRKILIFMQTKQFEDAIDICDNLLTLYPKNVDLLLLKAKLLGELGRYKDAFDCSVNANKIEPGKPETVALQLNLMFKKIFDW